MKKAISILLVTTLCLTLVFALIGCDNTKDLKDREYNNKVNAYAFWGNDITEAIPQTSVSNIVRDFLNTPSKDGKAKKVLFLGYDGCRADRMQDILDVNTGNPIDGVDSAILETMGDKGGIYLAYAGGNMSNSTKQPTVTGSGWGSLLTGVWGNKHKIRDNRDEKNRKYHSFVFDAATGKFNDGKIYSSAFVASCTQHFATQYIDEINYLREHPVTGANMPTEKKHKDFIKEKHEWSETYHDEQVRAYVKEVVANTSVPARYIFTSNEGAPEGYEGYFGDVATRDAMIAEINRGTDVIFGIIEETDHAGHDPKRRFSNGNDPSPAYNEAFARQDKLGADVIRAAKARALAENEDWLIIMTTDHGGYDDYHGKHSFEERTIWVAANRPIDSKYFSKDYDGFNAKKK